MPLRHEMNRVMSIRSYPYIGSNLRNVSFDGCVALLYLSYRLGDNARYVQTMEVL